MTTDENGPTSIDLPADYKVQIDKRYFETKIPLLTGRELLELADRKPAKQYAIYLKPKGGQPQRIELDQKVDLSEPGVERFVTLPLDQTEGFDARRDFDLPQEDLDWLHEAYGGKFELVAEGNVLRVVLYGFQVPAGYDQREVDVNVRIESGYPDTQIDMVYVSPPLTLTSGKAIGATAEDRFDGKQWQRWSRHRTAENPWRPGIDNLATHFALVDHWFERELPKD